MGYATGSGLYPFTDFLFPENKYAFEANRCLISEGKRVDQTLEWNMPPPPPQRLLTLFLANGSFSSAQTGFLATAWQHFITRRRPRGLPTNAVESCDLGVPEHARVPSGEYQHMRLSTELCCAFKRQSESRWKCIKSAHHEIRLNQS